MIDFEWQQNPALIKELNALDTAMRDKVMNLLLGRVIAPVVKQAKANAPSKSGALKNSIGQKKLNRKERTQQSIRVGDAAKGVGATRKVLDAVVIAGGRVIRKRKSQAYKLRFIEEGTKRHHLYRTQRQRLRQRNKAIKLGGRWVRLNDINHPGTKANPFLTRAWKSQEPQMAGRFITELEKWVQKNAPKQFT